jgi:predicted aspartyl protease
VCKAKKQAHTVDVHVTDNTYAEDEAESEFLYLDADSLCVSSVTDSEFFSSNSKSKWLINVQIGAQSFTAKVDTGAEVSVISRSSAKGLGITRIRKCNTTVTAYTGKPIPIIGRVDLDISVVCAGSPRQCIETFYVVDQNSTALLGMPAIRALKLIPAIDQVSSSTSVSANACGEIMAKYKHVFEGLGKFHTPVSLQLKDGAIPKATPPRQVPDKVRPRLKTELDRLVDEQIIARDKEPSEWLSPPVIVNKPDNSIRLCLDPQYLNTQLVRTRCALSTPTSH